MAVITNVWKCGRRTIFPSFVVICFCLLPVLCEEEADINFNFSEIPGIDPDEFEEPIGKIRRGATRHVDEIKKEKLPQDYYQMHAGKKLFLTSDGKRKLHIFCYNGESKVLITVFKTVELHLDIEDDNFHHYEGQNSSVVRQQHQDASWLAFYPWRVRTFKLDLYKPSCIGIDSKNGFKVELRVRWVDFWRVTMLLSAVVLFFMSRHLAKNVFFHYTTGITFGVFGSLLILVYILARLIPKKSGAVTVMIGGWGLAVYLIQYLWQNLVTIIKENHAIAVGYVVVAGLISFAIVYRYGPLTDQRSINLVQWAMQMVAIIVVFLSSQYREATLGLVIVMLSYHNVPDKWKAKALTYWRRRFPPKVRPLTEEEYIQQANVETRKALEELRSFCRSPGCDAWKTVSRLKSPQRFAEFVEGGSHLDDDMILAYESNHLTPTRLDDEELFLTTDSEEDAD
ncbi:nuclear envelope integral membrane protein 1-like isoform X2 [Penaeus monodon]|uniref:nuclear envelope integral membrane protein 1-like isoform X2 n=1 Tax=Penaeus monodon TaxID=6687 RepID=UPI0018A7D30D|nr:nuclear envelope integral membrane protein 1-like isoform X2 [Penaeus monodon]